MVQKLEAVYTAQENFASYTEKPEVTLSVTDFYLLCIWELWGRETDILNTNGD